MNKKVLIGIGIVVIIAVILILLKYKPEPTATNPSPSPTPAPTMKITSSAFAEAGAIPEEYTCKVASPVNPELMFSNVPKEAKSLTLIMHDPDAPLAGGFTHWVIYNMPPETTEIPKNSKPPGVQGKNGKDTNEYVGPCPPSGTHRYFFYLYALDTKLSDDPSLNKSGLENAMQQHIIAQAELMASVSH